MYDPATAPIGNQENFKIAKSHDIPFTPPVIEIPGGQASGAGTGSSTGSGIAVPS